MFGESYYFLPVIAIKNSMTLAKLLQPSELFFFLILERRELDDVIFNRLFNFNII